MISSSIPFPPVSWWIYACAARTVTFDLAEHYQKMSYRNRYYLAAPEGRLLMSIPLDQGRNQRIPVADVKISARTGWQDQHWKTLTSLYGRSPFFEYFEHLLRPLFEKEYEHLHNFNKESIAWVDQALNLQLSFEETQHFQRDYAGDITDLRNSLQPQQPLLSDIPSYYQVFAERIGFLPDCSILDLIFNEGRYATAILKK